MKLVLIVALISIVRGGYTHWHGYNESLMHRHSPKAVHAKQCKTFHEATRPYSTDFYQKLSLWSDVLNNPPAPHGETLYGSEEALQMIYENQNPVNCKNAKYLIFGGWAGGFGSRIHFEGTALAIAMELGRVYLPHPDGDNYFWETSTSFCKDRKEPGFTCYYMPVSRCTYADALASTKGDVNKLQTFSFAQMYDVINGSRASTLPQSVNLIYEARASDKSNTVMCWIPTSLQHLLHCSPLRNDAHVYWWRAVSATYLLRPNKAAKQWLAELTNNVSSSSISGLNLNSSAGHSYFSSVNSVGIQVRHGDKMREMKLVPWLKYSEALQFMTNRSIVCGHSHCSNISSSDYSRSGNIFLITEDDKVLDEANQLSLLTDRNASDDTVRWNVLYSTFFNRSAMTLNLPLRDQRKVSHTVHHDLEYISMLHNLMYAVRCNSFICTLASNSCRLIDELRCTIGAKCNRHYADLSMESCFEPPCVDGHGYIYNFQN